MKKQKVYFEYLDTYRFYAFLIVFISHMIVFLRFPPVKISFEHLFNTFTQISDLGVAFFFVLSGFLINFLLENERKASTKNNISIRKFCVRRILRIWPLYFISILSIFILSWLILAISNFKFYEIFINSKEFLYHIFMSGSIFRGLYGTDNDMLAVLWSISVEEQFYLVWPLLFYKFRKKIFVVISTLILVSTFSRYYFFGDYDAMRYLTPTIMSYLMIGGIVGIYYEKVLKFLSKFTYINSKVSLILILIFIYIRGYIFNFNLPLLLEISQPLIFGTLFSIIIILGTIKTKKVSSENNSKLILFRSRWHKIKVYLGTISYGLYVYHMISLTIILSFFDKFIRRYVYRQANNIISISEFVLISTLCLILTVAISSLSFKYIEKPFLKLKEKF